VEEYGRVLIRCHDYYIVWHKRTTGKKSHTHNHTQTHTQYSPCLTQITNAHLPITKSKAIPLKVTCSVSFAKLSQFLTQNKLLDINLDIEAVQCLSEHRQTGAIITRKYEQCIGHVSLRINLVSAVTFLLRSLAETWGGSTQT
jgi:hypothetical protein